MRTIKIDCRAIRNWETFHDVFQQAFGFPSWYGRNPDAWIDCMTWLDEADTSDFKVLPGECVLLDLSNASELKRTAPDILAATLEMVAFCNWRRAEKGYSPLLLVSCYA